MKNTMTAEQILHLLETQRFANWYADEGELGKYIMGDRGAKSKEEILNEIRAMFCLH